MRFEIARKGNALLPGTGLPHRITCNARPDLRCSCQAPVQGGSAAYGLWAEPVGYDVAIAVVSGIIYFEVYGSVAVKAGYSPPAHLSLFDLRARVAHRRPPRQPITKNEMPGLEKMTESA
jgi:hypothetical protein